MSEVFAASMTTIDIVLIYTFLQIRRGKFWLIIWTAILNILLPLCGFLIGELSTYVFTSWSNVLSGVLLCLIGVHILLQTDEASSIAIHPFLLAFAVSIDAFTVSVSFGMMQFNKQLFVLASGIFAFLFSAIALYNKRYTHLRFNKYLRRLAGVTFIIIGGISCFQIY